jgi:hypothetical protein
MALRDRSAAGAARGARIHPAESESSINFSILHDDPLRV